MSQKENALKLVKSYIAVLEAQLTFAKTLAKETGGKVSKVADEEDADESDDEDEEEEAPKTKKGKKKAKPAADEDDEEDEESDESEDEEDADESEDEEEESDDEEDADESEDEEDDEAPVKGKKGAITLDQINNAFKKYAKTNPKGRPGALKVLTKFGVKSTKELKPKQYATVLEAIT